MSSIAQPPARKPQCNSCTYAEPMLFYVNHEARIELHCSQGVPGVPNRYDCPTYQREVEADDD